MSSCAYPQSDNSCVLAVGVKHGGMELVAFLGRIVWSDDVMELMKTKSQSGPETMTALPC